MNKAVEPCEFVFMETFLLVEVITDVRPSSH